MSIETGAYRQVFKATSLFGGVQVFQIVIAVIRSKIIAVLLGPLGMGIASLINITINLIASISNLGLETSAVKDVSTAMGGEDSQKINNTVSVVKKLVWITGLAGMLLTILLSPLLSELAFGSAEYTFWFIWVSVALLFKQLTSGNMVILQGLRKLNSLAKANLLGSLVGLIITVPLYYYFRLQAIVPAIIISFLMAYLFSRYFSQKVDIKPVHVTTREAIVQGKEMIRLGIMLSISGLLVVIAAYVLQLYISHTGGEVQVGLYAAGIIIINIYVGSIFNAMATDYYPRLAAVNTDNSKVRELVTQQAFIAIFIITPIIILFLTFSSLVIKILYSGSFLLIIGMVSWGILGTLFKAMSFSMGYIIIAKGDSKVFIKTAVGFSSLLLLMNIVGYYYGGLTGLGISFFLYYIIHFLVVGILTRKLYDFYFSGSFYLLFTVCFILSLLAFLTSLFIDQTLWRYGILIFILIISIGLSLYQLNKKMDIRGILYNFTHRKNK